MEGYLVASLHLLTALMIGLLIGVERELKAKKEEESAVSGIRTFSLVGVIGFFFTYLLLDTPFLLMIGIGSLIVIILSIPLIKEKMAAPGLTSATALVVVLLCGSLAGLKLPLLAVFCGVTTYGILDIKEQTHRFVGLLSEEDIMSGLRFLMVAFILIPLAYTIGEVHPLVGPGNVFDPVKTLLMIVFVSSISFVSYILIRFVGASKGLELSAFLGGFVSSAASTASLSQKSCEDPSLRDVSVIGIIAANSSMFLKDMIIVTAIGGLMVFKVIGLPLILLFSLGLVLIFFPSKKTVEGEIDVDVKTPFAIIPAAKFGLLFILISALSYFSKSFFGSYGLYAAALGGLVSTTSVAASLGSLFLAGEISSFETLSVMMLTLVFGSVSKIAIAWSYDRELGKRVSVYLTVIAILTLTVAIIPFLIGK